MKYINLRKIFQHFFKSKVILIFFTIILVIINLSQIFIDNFIPINAASEIINIVFLIQFIIVSILFSISAFNLVSQEKIRFQKQLIEERNNYVKTLVDIQVEMKEFQHDYKNMLAALYLLAETNNIDKINNYLDNTNLNIDTRLINKINVSALLATINISNIKNTIITSLDFLYQKNIKLNLKIDNTILSKKYDDISISNDFNQFYNEMIAYSSKSKEIIVEISSNDYLKIKLRSLNYSKELIYYSLDDKYTPTTHYEGTQ